MVTQREDILKELNINNKSVNSNNSSTFTFADNKDNELDKYKFDKFDT